MRLFSLMSMYFTLQFAVSYYCIYEVDWIGWDHFEPLTYTVSHGTGLAGVFLVMRNRGANTAYTDLAEHL